MGYWLVQPAADQRETSEEKQESQDDGYCYHVDDQGSLGPVFTMNIAIAESPYQDHDESDQGKARNENGKGPFFGVKCPCV